RTQPSDVAGGVSLPRRVAGPEDQPDRHPRRPGLQGDMIAALRVVEGALVVVSAVMGVEVQTNRAWQRADEYDLSRVVVVNMLDRERADFFRTLEALRDQLSPRCVAVHLPIGAEHELTGVVDLLHMKAYT